jgi:hypothetical protein
MRRFRLRRLWRVNCEALMRAAGQNLKRLLKQPGWGRRPSPAEAFFAYFLVFSWWLTRPYLTDMPHSLVIGLDDPLSQRMSISLSC